MENSVINFAKIRTTLPVPDLIEVQKRSYDEFLQMDLLPDEREENGLQAIFKQVFPILDYRALFSLEFVEYSVGNYECKCGKLKGLENLRSECQHCSARIILDRKSGRNVLCLKCGKVNIGIQKVCANCGTSVTLKLKYNEQECKDRELTYAVPLKLKVRLVIYEEGAKKEKKLKESKEQEVYFGDIPLMTSQGTFIINGTERVIVNQLHRSPGVFFKLEGKNNYSAQLISFYASWVEFEYDAKGILYVRIDRKRKVLGTTFLRALGLGKNEDIISYFYKTHKMKLVDGYFRVALNELLVGLKAAERIKDKKGKVLLEVDQKISESRYQKLLNAGIEAVSVALEELPEHTYLASD